ncbi:B2-aldehyde-forming enzyme [Cryptococcus wingfieldii CBS 7118]|uniref:B2-aldehyde-forming enzyme n=1 Tax=Cryptococcus wingfieldii CBS 7118 TaxID=1295528 RepID=A0A1E3IJN1_9TREE|nr:B2-aldehyde-forming enzyme [Cryptococcus wingfieldii CBS 7118]ODN88802.1 B2-aldehyde-forming enzyme [Cryptococcus wingfieldii CBS 7118]
MLALLALFHLLPILALAAHSPPHHRRAHERARKNYEHVHGRDAAHNAPAIVERDTHFDNRTLVERDHYDNRTLTPRADTFTGVGTFYATGLGACGQSSQDSDYLVALNSAQYGGGYPGPQCFKTITISDGSTSVSGITIMDECPTCDYGSLDLSPGLFTRFADEDAGTIHITWWYEDSEPTSAAATSTSPTSTYVAPTSTYTPPTSTYTSPTSTYVAPTSTYTPPTSTYTPPTSTYTPPSSTWVAPSSSSSAWPSVEPSTSSSTSIWVAPSSYESSSAPSSTITSSPISSAAISASASASNSTNPWAVISSASDVSIQASASVGVSVSTDGSDSSVSVSVSGNLELINALTANYGQLVVNAAQVDA